MSLIDRIETIVRDFGPVTPGEIKAHLDEPNRRHDVVSSALNRLRKKGRIEVKPNPESSGYLYVLAGKQARINQLASGHWGEAAGRTS